MTCFKKPTGKVLFLVDQVKRLTTNSIKTTSILPPKLCPSSKKKTF